METSIEPQENENPSLISSPNTYTTTTCSTNGPHLPQPITRSDSNNPYPTTFVQADTSSFKQVVQMLTGSSSSEPSKQPLNSKNTIPPIKKNQVFKLYERRNSSKSFKISPLTPGNVSGFSPRNKQEILSPSMLDFPSLVLSPVTPLMIDPFTRIGSGYDLKEVEEKAIAEKGFYLHPSPGRKLEEPRLLPLFPVTSPRFTGSSDSSNE